MNGEPINAVTSPFMETFCRVLFLFLFLARVLVGPTNHSLNPTTSTLSTVYYSMGDTVCYIVSVKGALLYKHSNRFVSADVFDVMSFKIAEFVFSASAY